MDSRREEEHRQRHREEDAHREFTPMHGSFPDPEKIACKNCAFRDKTVVELLGKRIASGYTKGSCEMYSLKPHAVLFNNAPCQNYRKDQDATGVYKTILEAK